MTISGGHPTEKMTRIGDTLIISFGPSLVNSQKYRNVDHFYGDSEIVYPDAVFHMQVGTDSIVLTALNDGCAMMLPNLLNPYWNSAYSLRPYVRTTLNSVLYKNRLVYIPLSKYFHKQVWKYLYFSMEYSPAYTYAGGLTDLIIDSSGAVHRDERSTKNNLQDSPIVWRDKSFILLLKSTEMDTLRLLINEAALSVAPISSSGYCSHATYFRMKLDTDTNIYQWYDCGYFFNVSPISDYLSKIIDARHGKEIPFKGFHSRCSFTRKLDD